MTLMITLPFAFFHVCNVSSVNRDMIISVKVRA